MHFRDAKFFQLHFLREELSLRPAVIKFVQMTPILTIGQIAHLCITAVFKVVTPQQMQF
jgi:hypothetical protein